MTSNPTHMRAEVEEIPVAVQRLLTESAAAMATAGQALKDKAPSFITTIARGSSDHASSFLKYAIELTAGVPVASLAPSVASVYGVNLNLSNAATIAISQSGESPDILAMTRSATANGALTITLTNKAQSPLAAASNMSVDIVAGPELSVAATKSYVNSIVAGLGVLAAWQDDEALSSALLNLPKHLSEALEKDWSALSDLLDKNNSLFILGRGPSLAIASEVALKFKETCGLHAEAYSAAEVMHGPLALIEPGFPVLALCARDASEASSVAATEKLTASGAAAFITSSRADKTTKLGFVDTGHPLTDALCLVVPFYTFVEKYARHRGLNPDKPPRLRKVTETR
jgi:glucosamine--fructose-6-phosphate aminotransferase (isomerizing)